MVAQETLSNCPFCHKLTVKILHVPFVANTFTSKCRAGGKTTIYQKERFDVLSGCEACGKNQKEIQDQFNGKKEINHEERITRMKNAGIPTAYEDKVVHNDED